MCSYMPWPALPGYHWWYFLVDCKCTTNSIASRFVHFLFQDLNVVPRLSDTRGSFSWQRWKDELLLFPLIHIVSL